MGGTGFSIGFVVGQCSGGMSWLLEACCWAGFFMAFRGGVVALESSGMPTVLNNLRSQTSDRSSTPSDNRRVRVSNWYTPTHIQLGTLGKNIQIKMFFNSFGVLTCVCAQPDGAESVASLHSSDSASEKKTAGHQRTNSGAPTISVSRASVSSGTSATTQTSTFTLSGFFVLFCFTLKQRDSSSHSNVSLSQFQDVLEAAMSNQRWC